MKMKRIFSFTFAILLAVSASCPALAAENDFNPPEPAPTEEVQLPEETDNEEEIVPPTDEDPPEETLPPTDEEPPEETLPPTDEEPPEETIPPMDEEIPDDTLPPTDEALPDDTLPPLDEQLPDDILPPVEEQPVEDLINVAVPATGQVILNPYRLPVDTDTGAAYEQIIHAPQELVNYSDFPVMVTAAVTGTLAGDAWLVTAPPAGDAAAKELFLYAEFQPQPETWVGSYTGAANQLLVNDSAGDVLLLAAGGAGYFRLFGDMSPYPQSMWGDENALTVTISYTFTRDPSSVPAEPEIPDQFLDQWVEQPLEPENPENPEEPEIPEETEVVPEETAESNETADPGDTVEPPGTPPPLEPYDIPAQSEEENMYTHER